jgi:hypothetical protein
MQNIDPVVHAALVVVFSWLLKLACNALGFDLTQDIYTQLAGLIVAYILSLFGFALYVQATRQAAFSSNRWYKPLFT